MLNRQFSPQRRGQFQNRNVRWLNPRCGNALQDAAAVCSSQLGHVTVGFASPSRNAPNASPKLGGKSGAKFLAQRGQANSWSIGIANALIHGSAFTSTPQGSEFQNW